MLSFIRPASLVVFGWWRIFKAGRAHQLETDRRARLLRVDNETEFDGSQSVACRFTLSFDLLKAG
jgi:hypothetical protein